MLSPARREIAALSSIHEISRENRAKEVVLGNVDCVISTEPVEHLHSNARTERD